MIYFLISSKVFFVGINRFPNKYSHDCFFNFLFHTYFEIWSNFFHEYMPIFLGLLQNYVFFLFVSSPFSLDLNSLPLFFYTHIISCSVVILYF